jgi:hypothetical protein
VVTLAYKESPGSMFNGWGGACAGQSMSLTCTVTVNAATSVTVRFDLLHWQLDIGQSGTVLGLVTSNPPGIDCPTACTTTFANGTVVTLTATAPAGSMFTGWTDACSGQGTTCTFTMTAAHIIYASFNKVVTLTVNRAGTGDGTVTSNPAGITCGTDCTEDYPTGTLLTLTAQPAAGSTFVRWDGICYGLGNPCQVEYYGGSVTATFGPAQLATLTVSKSGTGTVIVTSDDGGINCGSDCSEVYPRNRVVTLTVTPTNGTTFLGWTGACSGTAPTCTVTMSGNKSVGVKTKR